MSWLSSPPGSPSRVTAPSFCEKHSWREKRIVLLLHERRMLFRSAGLWTGQAVHWWSYSSSIGERVFHFLFQYITSTVSHPSVVWTCKRNCFYFPLQHTRFGSVTASWALVCSQTGLAWVRAYSARSHCPTTPQLQSVGVCERKKKSHLLYSSS